MSTESGSQLPPLKAPENMRVAIVTTLWNRQITEALTNGCVDTLEESGVNLAENVDVFHVPGAVELTYAASLLIEKGEYDAIIVFGCVIKGDTPHFDYVCQSVTQGITHLNAECDVPVIFGVLTVNDVKQAIDRAGGKLGNKGSEAALTAVSMVQFRRQVEDM